MNVRERPRIVAGYGRSGTTWVLDVLAQANSLRAIFEPLHPKAVPEAAGISRRYLTQHDDDKAVESFFEQYFHGDVHSIWADYRIRTGWLNPGIDNLRSWAKFKAAVSRFSRGRSYYFRYRAQRHHPERIVKLIRANMMISWLHERFDARIIFVIRHPAAVVLSQFSSPRSWDPQKQLSSYRSDQRLVETINGGMRALLSEPLDHTEALTLAWCIENSIAMDQATASNIPVVYYEHLLEYGDTEWARILSALNLSVMPDSELVATPSQQAWGKSARDPSLVKRYKSWMNRIEPEMAGRIQRVLDESGMGVYNIHQALPILDGTSARTESQGVE